MPRKLPGQGGTKLAMALAILAVFIGLPAIALEPTTPLSRLPQQSWTMENGLPQNVVSALLQSSDGYLWAGTEVGLARFDGLGFRILSHGALPGFPDAEIRCLLETQPGKGQTSGSLWIGTGDGLVQWQHDRLRTFTTQDGLPGNSIRGLIVAAGALWVWTEDGLAQLTIAEPEPGRNLRFVQVPLPAGANAGGITSLAGDNRGGLWLGTSTGAYLWTHDRWTPSPGRGPGLTNGPSAARVQSVAGGDVLIADAGGVALVHDETRQLRIAANLLPQDGISFLARLADGRVVAASKSILVLSGEPSGKGTGARLTVGHELPGSRIETVYADREGSLWIGTNRGLARIRPAQAGVHDPVVVDLLLATDALSTQAVVAFLEDREGDLWVGTDSAGLHILRDSRFRTLGANDGLSSDATTAILPDSQGGLWIGTRDSGLDHWREASDEKAAQPATNLTTKQGLLSDVILSLARAANGALWVGTPDGLNRIGPGGTRSYTSADGLPDDFIRSLFAEPDGTVWIGTRRGLTHLDPRGNVPQMKTLTQADGLGSNLIGALERTGSGDLWIGTLNGLARLENGRLRNYTTADGLSSNVITALHAGSQGLLWIGTQGGGLNLWDGQKLRAVGQSTKDGPVPATIHAVMEDDRGFLWLASDSGLTRARARELHACAEETKCRLHSDHFSTADGLRSRTMSSNSHPTAARSEDGTLWFTTPRGVVAVDPNHFAALPGPPPTVIERFSVDDEEPGGAAHPEAAQGKSAYDHSAYDMGSPMRIAAGHLRFQFDYAGLSFASPQKVRYAYRLEGFDSGWTDAGTRRTAYYTNIPPGTYRFRVRATLEESPLNSGAGDTDSLSYPTSEASSEAAMEFELLPHFYQTWWFRTVLGLALAALVFWIFRRRVLRVEREFRAVMAERNRIAREIHDTLAQGYVGISLQLEILGQLLRHGRSQAAVDHLARTQHLVREGLDDARQSIWALRSQDTQETTLPVRLRRLVEQAAEQANGSGLKTSLEVHGAFRSLEPEVEKEVLRIAQEAILNAKRHAAASRLTVRLEYRDRLVALTVTDDGKGFAAPPGNRNKLDGHYGLTGMQERAAVIHGEIEIESEPGRGTAVRLRVPAPDAGQEEAAVTSGQK